MSFYLISRFLHFIGIGLLATSNFGGWIIHNKYLKEDNLNNQFQLLKVLKIVGLLSPIASGIMIFTGITNLLGLGFAFNGQMISMRWIMEKLTLFTIALVYGTIMSIRSAKRGKLVASMVSGNATPEAFLLKEKYDKGSKIFFIVQSVLFLAILLRSVLKYQ